jgi:hypothetical protein
MGWSSHDDFITEVTTNGKFWRNDWNKITGAAAYTAGRWYDMSALGGTPIANAWAGTSLTYTPCDESTGNGTQIFGLRHGGNVSTDTKHVLNVAAVTGVATGVPSVLMLIDMCGYWNNISLNSAVAQTLSGTPSLRYTNGVGVRAYMVPYSGTVGATAHNINISYTDQDGNTGNTLPVTVACTASAITPHITHSGTAANNYGPFLPLANGDYGIRNVASVTMSASSVGTSPLAALVLARPILTLPLTTVSVGAERDLMNQLPSLPKIPDGACLTWLLFSGAAVAASTNFYGSADFGWG